MFKVQSSRVVAIKFAKITWRNKKYPYDKTTSKVKQSRTCEINVPVDFVHKTSGLVPLLGEINYLVIWVSFSCHMVILELCT